MSTDTIAVPAIATPVKTRALRRVLVTARWHALAMLNWEVNPALVAELVPVGCELNFHGGKTYVSLVGCLSLDTRVLGMPIPGHRDFAQVALRLYVRRAASGGMRRGVALVKQIVPRWTIARCARLCYGVPCVPLPMEHAASGPAAEFVKGRGQGTGDRGQGERGTIRYGWWFGGRWHALELCYVGERVPLAAGSNEAFLAEHHYGFYGRSHGGTVEYEVEHPPWNVWRDCRATLEADVAALFPPPLTPVLSQPPTSALLADGSPVAVTRPVPIG